jgi:hypothetical protein
MNNFIRLTRRDKRTPGTRYAVFLRIDDITKMAAHPTCAPFTNVIYKDPETGYTNTRGMFVEESIDQIYEALSNYGFIKLLMAPQEDDEHDCIALFNPVNIFHYHVIPRNKQLCINGEIVVRESIDDLNKLFNVIEVKSE